MWGMETWRVKIQDCSRRCLRHHPETWPIIHGEVFSAPKADEDWHLAVLMRSIHVFSAPHVHGMLCRLAGSTAAKKAGSTEKGTLAFDEDEPEALTMPGGSSSASSKTGSTKLPEAFREDVTGNDTFRQKASKGDLPGAAKTSGMAANLLDSSAKSSDLLGSKTNSSGAAGAKKDSGVSGLSAGSFGGGASTDDERDMGPDMSSSSSKPGSLASKPGSKSTAGDDEDDLPFGMGSSSSSSKKGPSANKPGSKSTSGSMADDEEDSPFPMGSSSSSSSSSKKGSSGSKPGSKSVSGSMADDDDELDLGTGSSSSKMSKSQPGSTVSRGTAGSTSDSVGGLDERDEYSVGLGGKDSSKVNPERGPPYVALTQASRTHSQQSSFHHNTLHSSQIAPAAVLPARSCVLQLQTLQTGPSGKQMSGQAHMLLGAQSVQSSEGFLQVSRIFSLTSLASQLHHHLQNLVSCHQPRLL